MMMILGTPRFSGVFTPSTGLFQKKNWFYFFFLRKKQKQKQNNGLWVVCDCCQLSKVSNQHVYNKHVYNTYNMNERTFGLGAYHPSWKYRSLPDLHSFAGVEQRAFEGSFSHTKGTIFRNVWLDFKKKKKKRILLHWVMRPQPQVIIHSFIHSLTHSLFAPDPLRGLYVYRSSFIQKRQVF